MLGWPVASQLPRLAPLGLPASSPACLPPCLPSSPPACLPLPCLPLRQPPPPLCQPHLTSKMARLQLYPCPLHQPSLHPCSPLTSSGFMLRLGSFLKMSRTIAWTCGQQAAGVSSASQGRVARQGNTVQQLRCSRIQMARRTHKQHAHKRRKRASQPVNITPTLKPSCQRLCLKPHTRHCTPGTTQRTPAPSTPAPSTLAAATTASHISQPRPPTDLWHARHAPDHQHLLDVCGLHPRILHAAHARLHRAVQQALHQLLKLGPAGHRTHPTKKRRRRIWWLGC